eukprot:COSAG01_NODE_74976_length_199_cov_48.460000_1_plen_62_part_01
MQTAARVVARMQHRSAVAALGQWRERTQWTLRSKACMQRMLVRWAHKGMQRAWNSWRSWSDA